MSVNLILGNITFNHFSPKELEQFKQKTEQKALVHEVKAIIKCDTKEQAYNIGESLVNMFDAYLIPEEFGGEIVYECKKHISI